MGWTYDYVVWGISWQNLQLMMIDMPFVDYKETSKSNGKEDEEVIEIKSEADIPEYLKKYKKQN